MAAHPNGKRHLQVSAGALVRRTDIAAPPTIEADTAWRLLYQELFDFAPDAHVLTDTDGVIRAVNHAAGDMLRARKEFMVDKPLSFFIAPSDWASYYHWLLRVRAGQTDALTDRPLRVRPAQGPDRSMMVHVAAFADGHGPGRMLRWQLRR